MSFEPTEEQKALLTHDSSTHARVLAGPGTGKSATLVAYIDRIAQAGELGRVRLLTFTRAATAELAEKIAESDTATIERPSTIHSFAIAVLLRNPGMGNFPQPPRIADDWERSNIVDFMLAQKTGIRKNHIDRFRREMAAAWERLEPVPNPDHTAAERARFVAAWSEQRQIYGYTLLGELPFALREALRDHPDLDGADYDLLVVDEYQDLNACDLEVLKLMASRGVTVIGAGDDDQSIYSFRRAHPAGIRRFLEDYPGAIHYPLSVTHRCGRRIVEWANQVIRADLERPAEREVLEPADGCPDGEVALLSFPGDVSEAKGIAELVRHLIEDEELPADQILILVRGDHNGVFSKPIKVALAAADIEFSDADRPKQVLAEPNNRRLFELLRLLHHRTDSLAWASLLHLQPGIGPKLGEYIYDAAKSKGAQFGEALLATHEQGFPEAPQGSGDKAAALVEDTIKWIDSIEVPDTTPEGGWAQWIYDLGGEGIPPEPDDDLKEILFDLEDVVESELSLGQYLGQVGPLAKDRAASKSEGVRIMTMSTSKGLTVRATIIAGAEEGVVPLPRGDRSEETRLLYVAMTRAKEFLFITWARRRRGPTARTGRRDQVQAARTYSSLLKAGPVESQDGATFLKKRWS